MSKTLVVDASIVVGLLVLGFVVALLLAWYHGEVGRPGFSNLTSPTC